MSKLSKDQWREIAGHLRGRAKDWWEDHSEALMGLTIEELREIADDMAEGDTLAAKLAAVRKMDPKSWQAYRDGTTERLEEIARHRFAIYEALNELGERIAKVLGTAIRAVLRV